MSMKASPRPHVIDDTNHVHKCVVCSQAVPVLFKRQYLSKVTAAFPLRRFILHFAQLTAEQLHAVGTRRTS
jgi:hypothetical protein